ncbi:hypothetical protein [Nonomuraea sp. NPDC049158]|uniref:hypothetical protein n=1 Tax=Nonomuraea sp. NPDC049158 TaxID=3155649 RepID=UPI0033CB9695
MEPQDITSRRGAFTVIVGIAATFAFTGAIVGAVLLRAAGCSRPEVSIEPLPRASL